LQFSLYALRFSFIACERLFFPPGQTANLWRGALGAALHRIACSAECPGARTCEHRATCLYARVFEPSALSPGPSGLASHPRPFALRASHLEGCSISAGSAFHCGLHWFDTRNPAVDALRQAFAELGVRGIDSRRGRAELCSVTGDDSPLLLPLDSPPEPVDGIRVRFLTPTELKTAHGVAETPEFAVLAARVRDRLSTLSALYGEGPLPIDFRGFADRAARIQMPRCEIGRIAAERRSRRTGQVHPLGGFIGEAEYTGRLTEFVPYLQAACWTGVGRQTTWGKGELAVELL
jgi:hypothetical protein